MAPARERLDALRAVAAPMLVRVPGPGLVVDDHGWVAAVTGIPSVERVAAPPADRPVAVHGVGLCVPEPVPGGWLLRRRGAPARSLRLTLELDARPPRAVVDGTNVLGASAVHPARRGAGAAGPRRAGGHGRRGAQPALYGDARHAWSRCARRCRGCAAALGGMLLARPYRIAPEVEVVLPDLTSSPFAAASTAPAVRALARA